MADTRAKERAERRLREALTDAYQGAGTGPEFLNAVLKLHGALEQAFDVNLEVNAVELRQIPFSEKASRVTPIQAQRYNISNANLQRNHLVHNQREFTDSEIKKIADTFASFAIDSWPTLFGRAARPPAIHPPTHSSTKQTVHKEAQQSTEVRSDSTHANRPVQWRSLFLALLLLVAIIWLAGFTAYLWLDTNTPTYVTVITFIILIVLSLYGNRHLWRFLRSTSILKSFAIFSISLLLLALLLVPLSGSSEVPLVSEDANQRSSLEQVTVGSIKVLMANGASFAETHVLPRLGKILAEDSGTPAATEAPLLQPTESASSPETLTATPAAQLAVGMKATVVTDGGRLRIREAPMLTAPILAHLENGSAVSIVGGPTEGEQFTWWEVEDYGIRGWCAGDFLTGDSSP